MTLLLLITIVALVMFFVAFVSPKSGSKAQRRADQVIDIIKRKLQNKPKIVQKLFGTPPRISHKAIHKSAETGKKTCKKLPL